MATSLPASHAVNSERIITLDVLRGWALFGIFYAHMIYWYAGGPLPQDMYQPTNDIPSALALGVYLIFVIGKFFSIFSFLFGLSFYIQIQNLAQRQQPVFQRFGWRLLILGIIGFIHHIIWRADILTIYVPLGFLLIFCRNISNRTLLIVAALLVFNIPTKIAEVISLLWHGEVQLISGDLAAEGAEYYEVMKNGSLREMAVHNFYALQDKLVYQINTGRLLITFGFFLLGMFVGRMGYLHNTADHSASFRRWRKILLKAIGVCALVAIATAIALYAAGVKGEPSPWVIWFGGVLLEIFNVSLTSIYIISITLLMLKPRWQRLLTPLAGIGKMALTVYLSQTFLGLLIFSSFGLGLFGETSMILNTGICIALFAVQILFCNWWLRHFYYGPAEWLWRSATDLKWRSFRRRRAGSSVEGETAG